MRPRYYHQVVGVNSRLIRSRPPCSMSNCRASTAGPSCGKPTPTATRELFKAARLTVSWACRCGPRARHVWNQYVVRVPDGTRDRAARLLAEAKIGSEIYYPLGIHQQECFALGYAPAILPETQAGRPRKSLALPIFPELTAAEQRVVVEGPSEVLRHAPPSQRPAPNSWAPRPAREAGRSHEPQERYAV